VRTVLAHMGAATGQHGRTESLPEVQESVLEYAAPKWEERKEVKAAVGRGKMEDQRHEVMICNNGALWTLRLRRTDTGQIELPEIYDSEQDATCAAHKFILDRSKSHPTETWFCLAK